MRVLRDHIEVIGLPGSGKSTLVDQLKRHPEMPPVLPPHDPGAFSTLTAAAQLAVTGLLTIPRAMSPLICSRDGCWLIAKLSYRSAALKQRSGPKALLQDSGVLQPLVSFAAEYRNGLLPKLPAAELLSLLWLPRVVLYVRVPPELALERYRMRQVETGRRSEVRVTMDGFMEAHAACETIAEIYRQKADRDLVVVDNIHPLENMDLMNLVAKLRKHLDETGEMRNS